MKIVDHTYAFPYLHHTAPWKGRLKDPLLKKSLHSHLHYLMLTREDILGVELD